MRFAKGHGTGNDFLILPDPDDAIAVSPDLVARLCDRRTGLGADGILRAVRTPAAGEWFMDYRNADGSIAEMCGNGIRVFARYLLDHGLAAGPEFAVATRAGLRQVREEPSGEITVDMGTPVVLGRSAAVIGSRTCEGLEVSLGNPHLACVVDLPVADFDLSAPPVIDRDRFPGGANVEVVRVTGDRHLDMRVYERGSGVTLSCGTGAVAAAVAAQAAGLQHLADGRRRAGKAGRGPAGPAATGPAGRAGTGPVGPAGSWSVQVPGGRLTVTLTEATSLLTGPAVIVAEGVLDEAWLSGSADGATQLSVSRSSRS
jgi:diaminopimelate epimerase